MFRRALFLLFVAACRHQETPVVPSPAAAITISPNVPADVPGGADKADLRTGARFAWQQFIAMNWPAQQGKRDTPDTARKFGEKGGPLVWETFRSKVEIYPGNGNAATPPHGPYDAPPQYVYGVSVPPCAGQEPVATPAYANLDEISQVGFDHLYAGVLPGGPAPDDPARLIRFLSKANRTHFDYVVANEFWYGGDGSPYKTAAGNFVAAVANNKFPPAQPYVSFPIGMMEAKAAFRPLTQQEAASGRFQTARVRFYGGTEAAPCYREDVWGLLALHIIQKTPTALAFTWATFEQADNMLTTAGAPVEDDDGAVLVAGPPNTPALSYKDGQYVAGKAPLVSADAPFCGDPGSRLYYREIGTTYKNIPGGGNICIGGRMHAIPKTIVEVNRDAHAAIAAYEQQHGLRRSPWHHYKLVNVQTFPFDKSQISDDPESNRGRPTYFTSNMVVETDYTLQNHSGGPETRTGGAPSDLAGNFVAQAPQPPAVPTYQNAYLVRQDGTLAGRVNMGGCTGCHGLTQVIAGSDYSYLLSGSTVKAPEVPDSPHAVLTERYLGRFRRANPSSEP